MPRKISKNKSTEHRPKIDFSTAVSFHEHEDDYHCSSSYSDTTMVLNPREFKQKMMIATNILVECNAENQNLIDGKPAQSKDKSLLKKLKLYTNLPTAELEQINNNVRTRDRSFEKAMKDVKTIQLITLGFLADDIRTIMLKFILNLKTFPSKIDFLRELKSVTPKYTNEALPIYRLIKNKMVEYQHLPEFSRYLLTEHPERVYERTLYLNKMKELRLQERNFIYIEVRRIIPRTTSSGFIFGLAAFPSSGKLEKFFTKDSADLIAKKWLMQRILPLIEQDTVVVFSQPKKRKEISQQSKKAELMLWLDENGITYGKDPNTADLYNLYKRFRNKTKEIGIYNHVLLTAGFEVVDCPVEWKQLNFFKKIWTEVEVMDGYYTGKPEGIKQKILHATSSITDLEKIEESLVEEECKMWKEDSQMEEIIENVLEMIKRKEVLTADFSKECYGDRTEQFETRVGDIVWDIS